MSSEPKFPAWQPQVVPPMPDEWKQEMYSYLLQHPLPWVVKGGALMGSQAAPVTGRVNTDGTYTGDGFAASRSALGIYDVTYSSPFAAKPNVSVSLLSNRLVSTNPVDYQFDAETSTGFTIHWLTTATDVDVNWTFSALAVLS